MIDTRLDQAYRREPGRYLRGLLAWVWVEACLFTAPIGVFVAGRYEGISFGGFWLSLAAIELAVAACLWIGMARGKSIVEPLRAWVNGVNREPALADQAQEAAARLPNQQAGTLGVTGMALIAPTAIFTITTLSHHFTAADAGLCLVGAALMILYGVLLVYFGLELGLGPIRAELSREQGPGSTPSTVGIRLPTKLLVGLLALAMITGFATASLSVPRGSSVAGAANAFAVSIAIAATMGLLMVVPLVLSIRRPIRELIRGTRAVGSGDFSTRIPVTSSDELGELGASFNEMIDGLRERESLRETNVELVDELRASRARIVAAADASRRTVERDLHDGAQQRLVLLDLKLGLLERKVDDEPDAREAAAEVRAELKHALDELRDLAHGIYPAVLTSDGLAAALENAAAGAAIPVTVSSDGTRCYAAELEAAVYFCCLEALQNVGKYAGEDARATIRIGELNGEVSFEVADDGVGFDASGTASDGAGIQNMSDRIGALGGKLRVESRPGGGTRVVGAVPPILTQS